MDVKGKRVAPLVTRGQWHTHSAAAQIRTTHSAAVRLHALCQQQQVMILLVQGGPWHSLVLRRLVSVVPLVTQGQ